MPSHPEYYNTWNGSVEKKEKQNERANTRSASNLIKEKLFIFQLLRNAILYNLWDTEICDNFDHNHHAMINSS